VSVLSEDLGFVWTLSTFGVWFGVWFGSCVMHMNSLFHVKKFDNE
jgi:hypothetical protein